MNTEVFDPSAVELPQIKLVGKTYTLREQSKKSAAKLGKIQKKLEAIDESETDAIVVQLGEMLEVMLSDSEGLTEALTAAWDKDTFKIGTLYRSLAWLEKKQSELGAVGEG